MEINRRGLFKIAGFLALGFAGKQVTEELYASDDHKTSTPGTKRLAIVVDIKKCLAQGDCQDCITACHNSHNVPDFENPHHAVRWMWKDEYKNLFPTHDHWFTCDTYKQKPIIALCNHCDNPPCVRVCPTKATFKRESDGTVVIDPHRCIGCRYCIAACPYGARSCNWRDPRTEDGTKIYPDKEITHEYPPRVRGVVEKCTFCVERRAEGLAPKCVEACKANALIFGDVNDPDSEIRKVLADNYTILRKPELGTHPQAYYIV